jgi:hypothetical protein
MKGRGTAAAFSWVSNNGFFIFEFENSVWTEFNAAWFPSFGTAIEFVGINYGKPRAI